MLLSDMLLLLETYVDDSINNPDAVRWLNAGQNKMAVEVKAAFPQLTITSGLNTTFVFPEKFHETPVLYAAAMYKAQDSSMQEKESFLMQFRDGLQEFSENYDPPARYRDDAITQQFIATAAQTEFTITKEGYNYRFGNLRVYVNDRRTDYFLPVVTGFLYTDPAPILVGDAVTAVWEEHSDLYVRPAIYPGW